MRGRGTSPGWAHSLLSKKPVKQDDLKTHLLHFPIMRLDYQRKKKKGKTVLFRQLHFSLEYGVCDISLSFFCEFDPNL